MVKIGIDTFACAGGTMGVGVYLTQILRRFPPSAAMYELFGWDYDRFAYAEVSHGVQFISRCRIEGKTANALWHLFRYPGFAADRQLDVCFCPAAHKALPSRSPCPVVGTVHDMAAWWGTRQTREHLGAVLRMLMPSSLRGLDRVIAVSEFVKRELVELARVKENRIEVVPCGVDLEVFHPRPGGEEVVLIQPFSFRRPYILYASRLHHPVKNHIRLIEAFGIFKDKTKAPHRLVFAGSDDTGADRIKAAAAVSKYRNDIFFTGQFPSKSLPELTADADMVVFPSQYEGFGLGVLEAMASGVPTACARAASLPEIASEATLYFDPSESGEMAERMITLATDREIRQRYIDLGLARARLFTWESCAERTLQIIMEAA